MLTPFAPAPAPALCSSRSIALSPPSLSLTQAQALLPWSGFSKSVDELGVHSTHCPSPLRLGDFCLTTLPDGTSPLGTGNMPPLGDFKFSVCTALRPAYHRYFSKDLFFEFRLILKISKNFNLHHTEIH